MRRTLLYTNYLIPCRLSTDPEMYDLGWVWMAWMFIIRNSIGCGQCLRPKMLSDIFSFSFTLLLPNWLLISIRIYSGIARFPCDSMAFLWSDMFSANRCCLSLVNLLRAMFVAGVLLNVIGGFYRSLISLNGCTTYVLMYAKQSTLPLIIRKRRSTLHSKRSTGIPRRFARLDYY